VAPSIPRPYQLSLIDSQQNVLQRREVLGNREAFGADSLSILGAFSRKQDPAAFRFDISANSVGSYILEISVNMGLGFYVQAVDSPVVISVRGPSSA
jgi:hypothetical protein